MATCKTCCARYKKEVLEAKEEATIANQIKETFAFSANGTLYRVDYLGRVYKATPATLYTLTGGRRVTFKMIQRVLNGESLYKKSKKNKRA